MTTQSDKQPRSGGGWESGAAGGPAAIAHARRLLGRMYEIAMDRALLDDAATFQSDQELRSLDAIHRASARAMGSEPRAIVTYDQRMAAAAAGLGMLVETPN